MVTELQEYKRLYTKMVAEAEKQRKRADHFSKEARRCTGLAATREKELREAKRQINTLKKERDHLLETASANKQYAQRLEHRVSGGAKAKSLSNKNSTLRAKVKDLEAKLTKESELSSSQEVSLHRAADEIELLARALEMRAEDLQVDGNLKSGLLYEVAKYQQENHRMALELARQNALALRAEEELRETKRQREEELRSQQIDAGRDLEQQLEKKERALASAQQQVQSLATERDVALGYVQDQADKLTELERWKVEAQARALGVEDARLQDSRAAQQREGELKGQLNLAYKKEALVREALSRSEAGCADEHQRRVALEARVAEFQLEADNANAQAESLTERLFEAQELRDRHIEQQQTLEGALRAADSAREEAERLAETLTAQCKDTEAGHENEIQHLKNELCVLQHHPKNATIIHLSHTYEATTRRAALEAYRNSEEQRGRAASMQEAVLNEREQGKARLQEITEELERLHGAKNTLQRTLMEQVEEARAKQQAAMRARQLAEREASRLEAENAKLRVTDASRIAALHASRGSSSAHERAHASARAKCHSVPHSVRGGGAQQRPRTAGIRGRRLPFESDT